MAVAVIKQAVTDYRKLKESKTETRKIEGGWMCRTAVMKEIEDFLKKMGGGVLFGIGWWWVRRNGNFEKIKNE